MSRRRRPVSGPEPTFQDVRAFFAWSDWLDYEVLRPLAHARSNWELQWNHDLHRYEVEDDSFAGTLNALIDELAQTSPPARYHDDEDALAEYVVAELRWPIVKVGGRWEGAPYDAILAQGGFGDVEQARLVRAAAGRVRTAIRLGQSGFDEMEAGHQRVLAWVLTAVLYHRYHEE